MGMEWTAFNITIFAMFGLALIVFITLFFQTAGYGQHYTKKWGWTINNRWGWFWMEIPTVVIFAIYYFIGLAKYPSNAVSIVPLIFLFVWNLHYCQRTFIRLECQVFFAGGR